MSFPLWILSCSEEIETEVKEEIEPISPEVVLEKSSVAIAGITGLSPINASYKVILTNNGGDDSINVGLLYDTIKKLGNNSMLAELQSSDTSGNYFFNLDSLSVGTRYYIRAFAINDADTSFSETDSFSTISIKPPVVITNSGFTRGSIKIFGSGIVSSEGDNSVLSKGLCWSTDTNPTINNNHTSDGKGLNSFQSTIDGLEPSTTYYIRAYAKTEFLIAYGDEYSVTTIPKGEFTYTVHRTISNADEHYERIENAMKNAIYYYSNYTSIKKHLNVYYNPDVPTADGHINGTIRFGSKENYQETGTALHEIMHTVGVGQHWRWTNTDEFIKDGKYQKEHANHILQVMTKTPEAVISGDSKHFWPYGINGAHEDTGREMLYIMHTMIVQGMHEDGLPSEW